MENQPKLIIHCITYNQIRFIRQALDGFVMQKTKFPFKAFIADDCSTDGTEEVITEYAKLHPDIIVHVKRYKNLGVVENFLDLASSIKSEYVAICEGDDFWTDENKLQKQVDYLDKHQECSICFHPVNVFYDDKTIEDKIFPTPDFRFNKNILNLSDLLKHNFIQTNSCVYRWRFAKEDVREMFPTDIIPCDYYMHILHAQKGSIGFINEVMASYRRHEEGIWWDSRNVESSKKLHLKYGMQELNLYLAIENNIAQDKEKYHEKITLPYAMRFKNLFLENGEFQKAAAIISLCPDVLDEKISMGTKRKIKITLFGFIPLIKIQLYYGSKCWVKLFGIIPLLKVKW